MPEMRNVAGSQEQGSVTRNDLLRAVFKEGDMGVCEYLPEEDKLLIYNEELAVSQEIPQYIAGIMENSRFHPEDRWAAREFFLRRAGEETVLRVVAGDRTISTLIQMLPVPEYDPAKRLTVVMRDVTKEKRREALLEERAKRDSMTGLYNHFYGRELINEYLTQKDPYATCGMMVVDLDYFKNANDLYGHLFGNHVLVEVSRLFGQLFAASDILMRAGGDEFVVFLPNISHSALVRKAMELVQAVREIRFDEPDFSISCSVGVCFLQENDVGYTYDQLFENADWALYRAKENGRNCYVFCDNLQRYEQMEQKMPPRQDIDVRYLRNDIISTAFEIFEKNASFSVAIQTLMQVIGYRFGLDRITIAQTNFDNQSAGRQYQWCSENTPEALPESRSFTKEDFLTLFQCYDEYQTAVVHYDNVDMFSPDGAALLMQGGAKTALFAATYLDGKYTGAISYVVCKEKRHWSRLIRKELGEVTKIISAYLARSQAINQNNPHDRLWTEYDSVTGLLSFSKFHQLAEHLIVSQGARSYIMTYSDLAGFKYFNQKYGYAAGDQLLKEFSTFLIEKLSFLKDVYFARVIADQFLMLAPYQDVEQSFSRIDELNREFERMEAAKFQGAQIRIRTGIYVIEPDCESASHAIDAANYARKQITANHPSSIQVYDPELKNKQLLETEIINGIDKAMKDKRFLIYLQPKISLTDGHVVGAEALVRWKTPEGKLLPPDMFIPLCESSGRIEELDYYVFELVAQFLARNQKLGRKQIPISVNASILHASDPHAVQKYLDILERYNVDPRYVEIELTETATVDEYHSAKRWFQELRQAGIMTAMDDFGAGYSVLNSVIDIPVDTVKLDRGFVQTCTSGDKGAFFLKEMIGIIKGLGYRVVCEGIETEEQSHFLQDAECEQGQGYLFSRPLPVEEYEKFVYAEQSAGHSVSAWSASASQS